MKNLIIFLVLAAVAIVGFLVLRPDADTPTPSPSPSPSVAATPTSTPMPTTVTSPTATPTSTPAPTTVTSPTPTPTSAASPTPTPTQAAQPQTHVVSIRNFAYESATITVTRGDLVRFTNEDSAGHSATSDTGAFDTGILGQGSSGTIDTTSLQPGTYPYHCIPHPWMKGTIVVQ